MLLVIGTFSAQFFKKEDHMAIQLLHNGKTEKDTKTMVGDSTHFGLTSVFVFKCKEGDNSFNMQYSTKGIVEKMGKHCPENNLDSRNM